MTFSRKVSTRKFLKIAPEAPGNTAVIETKRKTLSAQDQGRKVNDLFHDLWVKKFKATKQLQSHST